MKKFLEDKKRDLKFKLAGPGHKLSDDSTAEPSSSNNPASASLNAALQRCAKQFPEKNKMPSSQGVKQIGEKSISISSEAEQKVKACGSNEKDVVLFSCEGFANEVFTLDQWKKKFRSHISSISADDPLQASILTIKSLNPEQEVQQCIRVLEKIISNLFHHPDQEKYKFIRIGNPNIQKVLAVEGAIEFLFAVGFEKENIYDEKDQKEEAYLVHRAKEGFDLNIIIKSLGEVKGYILSLDRNMKIFLPNEKSTNQEHPDEFYEWTVHDFRKEHKLRMSDLEKNLQLRTKKMRESGEKPKSKTSSPFTLIRVRLPDGLIIQLTFETHEKLAALRSFLNEKIEFFENFIFVSLPAKIYDEFDEEKSFLELELYPAIMLMVKWVDSNKEVKYTFKQKIED